MSGGGARVAETVSRTVHAVARDGAQRQAKQVEAPGAQSGSHPEGEPRAHGAARPFTLGAPGGAAIRIGGRHGIATPADRLPDDIGCAELMISVPQILFTNLTTAAAMLNTWRLFATGELRYSELVFDVQQGRMAPLIKSVKLNTSYLSS